MNNNNLNQQGYSNNQFLGQNLNLSIPPPPLPPRFPPPYVPLVPDQLHPSTPMNYPPFPLQQLTPSAEQSSVHASRPWGSQRGHYRDYPLNQRPTLNNQFTQPKNDHEPNIPHLLAGGKSFYPPPPVYSTPNISHKPVIQHPVTKQVLEKKSPHTDVCGPIHSSPSWDSGVTHPVNILMQPPPVVKKSIPEQETAQDWIDQWTKNKIKLRSQKGDIKIRAVKAKLDTALKLVRELENSSRTLGVMVKTVSSEKWDKKCEEIEENKKKLLILLDELNLSEVEFKCLKEKISKRTKKRVRLRRQSDKLKKQKLEEKVKEQNLNVQIDNWQREMLERVERVKREEDLKKEADAVLWGVTQKKTEAKRQVATLAALLNLRSVRVARLTAAGLPVSQSQIDTFNTVIEKLKQMWSAHLDECQLEEQALRGMLSGSLPSARSDEVATHRRLVLGPWESAILGTAAADTPPTPDELVHIRRSWDRFAVPQPSLLASAVPPGVVLPVPPSSDDWKSFLKY